MTDAITRAVRASTVGSLQCAKFGALNGHPPTGRVLIAAPERMSLDTVRVFVIAKLPWIKKQQRKLLDQERETPREYIGRESHHVWGKRYLLKVVEGDQPAS